MTKGATDEQLRDFFELYSYTKNLEARKEDILRLIDEKGLLTPELIDHLRRRKIQKPQLQRQKDLSH